MANVKYRYLGYGYTNDNGIATLDYDANGDPLQSSGLVGTGAGKLDVVASLDDLSGITITPNTSTINDTGSTYTLSATVTNNNVAVNNETVCFELYKVSDGSLVDTLTGVTNSSGVVTVSYLGNHTGDLYIKVKTQNISQTIEISDFKYVDKATQSDHSDIWDNTSILDRQSDGTVLSNPQASTWVAVGLKTNNSTNIPLTDGVTFEIEITNLNLQNNGNNRIYLIGWSAYVQITQIGKYKFVLSDKIYVYCNGNLLNEVTYDTSVSNANFYLTITNNSSSVKFKNCGYY